MLCKSRIWIVCVLLMTVGFILQSRQLNGQEVRKAATGQAAVDTRPRVRDTEKAAVAAQDKAVEGSAMFTNGIIWGNKRHDGSSADIKNPFVVLFKSLCGMDPGFDETAEGLLKYIPSNPDFLNKGDIKALDRLVDSLDLRGLPRWMCRPDMGAFEREVTDLPTITIVSVSPVCEGSPQGSIEYADVENMPDAFGVIFPEEWQKGDIPNKSFAFKGDPLLFRIPVDMPVGEYPCTLIVKGGEGCETEHPFTLQIRKVVTPKAVIALEGPSAICAGEKASLRITFTGEGPYAYQLDDGSDEYYFSGVNAITGQPATDTIIQKEITQSSIYTLLSVRQADGCGDEGTTSGSARVTVVPLPTASLSAVATSVCEGEMVPLALEFTGDAPYTYRVTGFDKDRVALADKDTIWVPGSSDAYTVTALTAQGCAFNSNEVTPVIIMQNKKPEITVLGSDKVICKKENWLIESGMSAEGITVTLMPPTVTPTEGIIKQGWLLDGEEITLPYQVKNEDKNKTLSYYATNDCGRTESASGILLDVEDSSLTGLTIAGTEVEKIREYDATLVAAVKTLGEVSGKTLSSHDVTVSALASYTTAGIGTGKTIIIKYTLNGADANLYAAPAREYLTDGEIKKRTLNIDGDAVEDKPYDGTVFAAIGGGLLAGVIEGEDVQCSLTATFGQKDIGTDLAVTVNAGWLSGKDCGNYSEPALPEGLTASILPKELTVTGTKVVSDKAWDGNTKAKISEPGDMLGTVTGEQVGFTAEGFYAQSDPGTDLPIRIIYTLKGETSVTANYKKPADNTDFKGSIYMAPSIAPITAPASICAGGTIALTDPAVDDPDNKVIRKWWSLDGVELPTRAPQLAADDNGKLLCFNIQTSEVVAHSNEVPVTVHALPAVKISGGGSICSPGDQAFVRIEFTAGTAPFEWYLSGETDSRTLTEGNVEVLTVAPLVQTYYRVTSVMDANGCVAENLGDEVVVSPGEKPTAVISGDAMICAGGSATVKIVFTGPAPYYYRLTGDVAERVAYDKIAYATVTPENDPAREGTYTMPYQVEYLEANGCIAGVAEDCRGMANITVNDVKIAELDDKWVGTSTGYLEYAAPEVKGAYTGGYWYLNGVEITMPYQVKKTDNGARLTYRVTNVCGDPVESPNYTLLDVTDGAKVLTIAPPTFAKDKIYDGTTTVKNITVGALSGITEGETVSPIASGSYNSSAAATGKTITIYYTLAGEHAGNYAPPAPYSIQTGQIKPVQLMIADASAKDKVYDASVNAEVTAGALSGVIPAEAGNINVFAQGAFGTKAVGVDKTVTVDYTLTGIGVGNYLPPINNTTTATITPRVLQVIGTEVETEKLYDGTTSATVIAKGRPEGVIPGDIVGFQVKAEYDNEYPGTGRTITVTYVPNSSGDAQNYQWPESYKVYDAVIIGKPTIGDFTPPGNLCAGEVINLPAPEVTANGGVLTDPGTWVLDGAEIRMPYTVSIADAGKTLTYRAANRAGEAHSTTEAVLTVNELPTVELTAAPICAVGETATINMTFTGAAPFKYALSDGTAGELAEGTQTVASVYPSATTAYTVTRLSDKNCSVEAPDGSATVMVGTYPTAVISGNVLVCPGGEAKIRIDFTGDAPYFYRLDGDTEDRRADVTPAEVPVPSANATYTLAYARAGECVIADENRKGKAKVTLLPSVEAAISGDATLCGGEPVELALTFKGGTGDYVYRLTGDTEDRYHTGDVAGSATTVTVIAATTTTYRIESLASGKCTDLTGSGSATVTRPALPTVAALAQLPSYTQPAMLDIAAPATENVVRECWLLGVDTIEMPYALKDEDNGKNLSYIVWNSCGDRAESNSVTVSIPDSPIKPLAVVGTEIETVRAYNGGTEARVIASGMLSPDPGAGVTLSVKASFIQGPNVGDKKVEVIYAIEGSDAVKYTAPQRRILDGRITPLVLDVSEPVVAKNKEYDGTTHVVPEATGGSPRNVLAGDDVQLTVRAAYNTRTAGVNREIVVNYTLSGLSSVNYSSPADFVISDAEIRQKALTIEDPNLVKEKIYDGKRDAIVTPGALLGLIEGDDVRALASALYDNRNAGDTKIITVGYELVGGDAVNYTRPGDRDEVGAKIARLQLGVEGTEITREKKYDGEVLANVANPGRLTNAIHSDTVHLKVTAQYDTPDIGTGKTITIAYNVEGTNARNYIAPTGYTLNDGVISECPTIAVPVVTPLCAGANLDVARPVVSLNGSTQEGNGWWTLNGEVIDMPYPAKDEDHGAALKYHVRTLACGVISSDEAMLTVNKLPVGILSGSQSICEGSSDEIKLTVNLSSGSEAGYSYRLTGDTDLRTGGVVGNNYPVIDPHPALTTRYELLELVDGNGCMAKDISGEAIVKVVPTPAVTLTGGGTVCEGETATLVLDFTGEAPFTYAINGGDETTTYDKHVEVTLTPAVAGDYSVTSLKSGSCPAGDLSAAKVTVKVNKAPALTELTGDLCKSVADEITLIEPIATGQVVLHKGWTLAGAAQTVPWIAAAADHGKTIRFWAENQCGRTESNGLQVLIKSVTTPVLLVKGVKVKEKTYDGQVTAVIDMSEATIWKQSMNNSDCKLTLGDEVTDVELTATGYFDNARVGDEHKVYVSFEIVSVESGDTYITPGDTILENGKITPAILTVEGPRLVASRPYDATTRTTVTAGAINSPGVVFGDEVRVSVAAAAFQDKHAGENKPVDITYRLGGRSAGNYTLNPMTAIAYAAITPIPLSISGVEVQKEKLYDGNVKASISRQGTVSGVIVGDIVGVETEANYETPDMGENKKITRRFKHDVSKADHGNYTLPADDLMRGKIYGLPTYTSPIQGVGDALCAGDVLYPEAPGYQLNYASPVSEGWTISRDGISAPLRAPYKVGIEDNGAILKYVVRNTAGYGVDNDMNTKTLAVNDKPVVAKTLAPIQPREQNTELPEPPKPDVTGDATEKGWALVTRDQDIEEGESVTWPYTVTLADNGKYLVYWAKNDCGRTESNRVALNIFELWPVQLYADVMFEHKKRYDGNKEAKVLSVYNIRGVERGHKVDVEVKTATYDTELPGKDKTITVVYKLSGEDAGKYVAPVDYVVNDGWIFDKPWVELPADPGLLCDGDTINVPEPAFRDNAAQVLKTGWSLGNKTITMPHVVKAEDRGKLLSFWAVNTEGLGENQITLDVRPRPTVSMPKDTVINIGGVATITYRFNGTAPFTYSLKDGKSGVTTPSQSSFIDKVTPEHAQYYGVNALSDAYCTAWPVDLADSMIVRINGDNIRIMIGDTIFVYDGDPKTLEVRAEPEDRTDMLEVYYDGSTARPYLPGTYPTVVKFAGDWQFGPLQKNVTVIIEKAYADVFIDNLQHLYDGRPKQADVTSDPDGLNLKITYNDSTALPVASGQYRVHAEVDEGLWQGAADALLVIDEYIDKAQMINTIEVRGDNNTKFLVKDYERYTDMKVKIFDRGGKLVYKSDNYAGYEYDMRDLRAGTYYYVLSYKNEGRQETRRGAVTVIK